MYVYFFMKKKTTKKQIMHFGRQNRFIFLIILNILFLSLECLGPVEKWQNSRQLLGKLKQKMSDILPTSNVQEYNVSWAEKGW